MIVGLNFSALANGPSKERIVDLLNDITVDNGMNSYYLFYFLYTERIIDSFAKLLSDMQVTEDELVSENGLNLFKSFKNELQQNGCMWGMDKVGDSIKILLDIIKRSNFSSKCKLVNYYVVGEFAIIANIQNGEDVPERRYYFLLSNDDIKQQLTAKACPNSKKFNLSAFSKAITEFYWGISVDELVDNKNYSNELLVLLKFISDFVEGNIGGLPYKYTDEGLTADQYKELNDVLVERFIDDGLIDKYSYKISYDNRTGYIKSMDKTWLGRMCNG